MAERGRCRYAAALKAFDRALKIYQAAGDDAGIAFTLYGRGGTKRYLGEFPEAAADLLEALAGAPDREAECFTLMAMGGLLRMTGSYSESLVCYKHARKIAPTAYAKAYADCGIGNALRMQGDPKAMKFLEAAEKRYRRIGDRVSRPYTLLAMNRIDEAEKLFQETKDHRGLVYVDLFRGNAKRALAGAKKLGIQLEAAHATWMISPRRAAPLYKKLRAPALVSAEKIP